MSKSEDLLATVLADLKSGRYRLGSKLPPLRDLARANKVSVSVAVKVYDELKRRNLVETGGSRGTVVVAFASEDEKLSEQHRVSSVVELNQTYPYLPAVIKELATAFSDYSQRQGYIGPGVVDPRVLQNAAERWFKMTEIPLKGRAIQVTASGQSALFAILLFLRKRTRTVFVDNYTYFGLRFIIEALDFKPVVVDGDEDGMIPEALKSAININGSGVVYVMPTVHSPVAYSMPPERIVKLASIIRNGDCSIIEDDPFRYLASSPPPSFGDFYPSGTFSVCSFSKVYGAQTPLAFAAVPEASRSNLVLNTRSTFCEFSLPQSWVIAEWIMSGTIERHVELNRAACHRFHSLVQSIFPTSAISKMKEAPFAWLRLPSQWVSSPFVGSAMRNGVHVAGGDDFWVGGKRFGDFVRISAFPTSGPDQLEGALEILGSIYQRDRQSLT